MDSNCETTEISSSTLADIKELCEACPSEPECSSSSSSSSVYYASSSNKPTYPTCRSPQNNVGFGSIVTPLSEVTAENSGDKGYVRFLLRRKNKTVTLQWEPFSGKLTANGIKYLKVTQTICNLPPYPVCFPIYLKYKGVGRMTHVQIVPGNKNANIRFYLNTDGSSDNTQENDEISIPGGAVTWIMN